MKREAIETRYVYKIFRKICNKSCMRQKLLIFLIIEYEYYIVRPSLYAVLLPWKHPLFFT